MDPHPHPQRYTYIPELVNMTIFGKNIFVNVIKDPKMRTSWIIQLGAKSNEKCCCKRYSEERHMEHRGESLVRVKAETGVIWPQAEDHLESPEAGRSKDSPLEPSREAALPTP